jgi:hypothetical protein
VVGRVSADVPPNPFCVSRDCVKRGEPQHASLLLSPPPPRIELAFHAMYSQELVTRTFSFSPLREDGFHGSCIQLLRCHENKHGKVIISSDRHVSTSKIQIILIA